MELAGARVLVTGGTGFLGRNVVRELEAVSANVVGVGSADYDLRSRAEIDRLLDETAPDAVVHLAAVTGGIGANRAEPGSFFYENAIMGIELLEACRTHRVDKVVVAGTVCAYPKYTKVPFREEDLWDGYPEETNAPYGLAKKMLLSRVLGRLEGLAQLVTHADTEVAALRLQVDEALAFLRLQHDIVRDLLEELRPTLESRRGAG